MWSSAFNLTKKNHELTHGKYLLGTIDVALDSMLTTIPEVCLVAYKAKSGWKANGKIITKVFLRKRSKINESYMV